MTTMELNAQIWRDMAEIADVVVLILTSYGHYDDK